MEARITVNGVETALTEGAGNLWEADAVAPETEAASGYYPITLSVSWDGGQYQKDDADLTLGASLRLYAETPMAAVVTAVRIEVDGEEHELVKTGNRIWQTDVIAPSASSGQTEEGYYPVTLTAEFEPDGSIEKDDGDWDFGKALRLYVRENVPPTIGITTPTDGAYVRNGVTIRLRTYDEAGGSGIDRESILLKLDDVAVTDYTAVPFGNEWTVTYNPPTLTESTHTVFMRVADRDGNVTRFESAFTVDDTKPVLNLIDFPVRVVTNRATMTVNGETNDANLQTVVVSISVNGGDAGAVDVAADGTFSKAIGFAEGENRVIIRAVDGAGNEASLERTVLLDTTPPEIHSLTLSPDFDGSGGTRVRVRAEVY